MAVPTHGMIVVKVKLHKGPTDGVSPPPSLHPTWRNMAALHTTRITLKPASVMIDCCPLIALQSVEPDRHF